MGAFRRTIQIVWSILCLVTLFIAAALIYPIPYASDYIRQNIVGIETVDIILVIVLATIFLYFLVMFFYASFAPARHSRLDIKEERGTLRIHSGAVKSVALAALDSIDGLYDPDVDVKMYTRPEDTQVSAKVFVKEDRDLNNLGSLAQLKVKEAVKGTLGFEPKKVHIKMDRAKPEQKTQKRTNKKAPRVR